MIISSAGLSPQNPDVLTQIPDYESLFARLMAGHTLITGNSRLSRVLTGQYNQWRISRGDSQWHSPGIISWNLWLNKLWDGAALQGIAGTDRSVPGNRQLISLWESTLKTNTTGSETFTHKLLRPESLASQLRDTRKLIMEWQLDLNDPAWFGNDNENIRAFYQWNRAFESRCEAGNWISPEDRLNLLCKAIRGKLLVLSETIDLLGFDEFSPGQADLLSALVENGNKVSHLFITPRPAKTVLLKCRDSKTELQQMARWVRYWYEKEPGATIAVVVPDLQSQRQVVERQLREILTPEILTGIQGSRSSNLAPWNISMGTPLARVPMIKAAFDLLKLLDTRIDIQDIGRVLRSPWLRGSDAERNSRALLEKCLRDNYPRQLKLSELRYRAGEIKTHDRDRRELPKEQQKPETWNSPELLTVLIILTRFDADNKGSKPASAWAESLDRLLVSLGWPQTVPLPEETTYEHEHNWQALQAWREGLRELASLDATLPKIGQSAAINQLKQICHERIFQSKSPVSSIQVLGLYEISGLHFDHLWVLGLHNDNWPPGAKPNPFIPGKLQRDKQLPNSIPQRELKVAHSITRRLRDSAPDSVFSYPGQHEGEELLPSPLLDVIDINKVGDLPAWHGDNWRNIVAKADKPKIQRLEMPGPLTHETAKGGSSILKHQALCPFRAYASNRLGAEGLETPVDGISPMLHGSLVHSALEHFWKETRTQAALLKLDEEELGARVRKHVDFVTFEERGLKLRPAFRTVEAERVYRHVMDYLALEKGREAFEVTGFEQEILPVIEGQTVRLIIDRIDKLASGEKVIIDYKTGRVEPKKWFGDRPEDPQLPLYAISAAEIPVAVVFGIIRDDGCLYKGVVKRGGVLPALPPAENNRTRELVEAGKNMSETINNWRQILHQLMADFLAGQAEIDPKTGTRTCETSYCKLQSLCRVGELVQQERSL